MKTNKILAVGKESTLELEFQKPLDYPDLPDKLVNCWHSFYLLSILSDAV